MTMASTETTTETTTHAHAHAEELPTLKLTDTAAAKVHEISKEEGLDGQGLRVQVKGGGCSGFQYDLFFDEKATDMDLILESHGIQLFVDPLSLQYLEGTEIDYVEGLHGAGFKFVNPNVKGSCGCGSSFSV
ncbi:MAG: iron-sulfur cluster insertion protein ErpA [Deltaproteobacteria bacterium]|nr:iron-sulfur cluster insertion protein ErpA [Deltaproteobacteria bacterium]